VIVQTGGEGRYRYHTWRKR